MSEQIKLREFVSVRIFKLTIYECGERLHIALVDSLMMKRST